MAKTCFVIMPIGSQSFDGVEISANDLKALYDDLIREAVEKAYKDLHKDPDEGLQVTRADEISGPGVITADIFERIADSDYVIADITFPNPNVFYELGLRHATRSGTILLRKKNGPKPPFDVHVLRHIEYEDTSSGLKKLAEELTKSFKSYEEHPGRPDNQFLRTAEPRFVLPPGGETYQVLQIGKDGKPVWDWVRAHG